MATLVPFAVFSLQRQSSCPSAYKAAVTSYYYYTACSSVSTRSSRQVICLAKKTPSSGNASANGSKGLSLEEDDSIILEGLNDISNEALQVMLGKKSKSLMDILEDLDEAGEYLVKEGKLEAARFLLVIKGMLDHKMIPEKDELEGAYSTAFDKIWSLVEDSGWRVTVPDKPQGVDVLDDELIPPVLGQL